MYEYSLVSVPNSNVLAEVVVLAMITNLTGLALLCHLIPLGKHLKSRPFASAAF